MEYKKHETDNDSDIIMIDCPQEPMTSKENIKKPKTKKAKRKVKVGKNYTNDMETLYITQRLKVKRRKFTCVININNGYEKKKRCPSSIIRFARNECKKEAYYNRIVPICMRNNCFAGGSLNCCRPAGNRTFYSATKESKLSFSELESHARSKHMRCKEEFGIKKPELIIPSQKKVVLSPVSSIPLSVSDSAKVSYEDVSDKSFSSEDELDTLIKRTKERENKLYPTKPHSTLNTLPTNEGIASTYSSSASLHSTSTLLLQPEIDAYSPTTSPSYMRNVSMPYSPTKTPDWIKINYKPIESQDYKGIDTPYSPTDPTNTPNNELEDYEPENGVTTGSYSVANPSHIKIEVDHGNKKHVRDILDGWNVKSETNENNNLIKIKDIKREEEGDSEDHHNTAQYFETEVNRNDNCMIKTEKIKRENGNACDVNDNFEVFFKVEKL